MLLCLLVLTECGGGGGQSVGASGVLDVPQLSAPTRPPSFTLVVHSESPQPGVSLFTLATEAGIAVSGIGPTSPVSTEVERLSRVIVTSESGDAIVIGIGPSGLPECASDTEGRRWYLQEWPSSGRTCPQAFVRTDASDHAWILCGGDTAADVSILRGIWQQDIPSEPTRRDVSSGALSGASFVAGMQAVVAADLIGEIIRRTYVALRATESVRPALISLSNAMGLYSRMIASVSNPRDPTQYFRISASLSSQAIAVEGLPQAPWGGIVDVVLGYVEGAIVDGPVKLIVTNANLFLKLLPIAWWIGTKAGEAVPIDYIDWLVREFFDYAFPKVASAFGFERYHSDARDALVDRAESEIELARQLRTGLPFAYSFRTSFTTDSGPDGPGSVSVSAGSSAVSFSVEAKLSAYDAPLEYYVGGESVDARLDVKFYVRNDMIALGRLSGWMSTSAQRGPHDADQAWLGWPSPGASWDSIRADGALLWNRSAAEMGPETFTPGYSRLHLLNAKAYVARPHRFGAGPSNAQFNGVAELNFASSPPRIESVDLLALTKAPEFWDPLYLEDFVYVYPLAQVVAYDPDDAPIAGAGIVSQEIQTYTADGREFKGRYPFAVARGSTIDVVVRVTVRDDEGEIREQTRTIPYYIPLFGR